MSIVSEKFSLPPKYSSILFERIRNGKNQINDESKEIKVEILKNGEVVLVVCMVDCKKKLIGKKVKRKFQDCGVIIVPQGNEWIYEFATEKSRVEFAMQQGFGMVLIVFLERSFKPWFLNKTYEEIQNDLKTILTKLLLDDSQNICFFSNQVGQEIGTRHLLDVSSSLYSGVMFVEDIMDYHQSIKSPVMVRRLIFDADPCAIQSEARLVKSSLNSEINEIDITYLPFEYHQAIVAGFVMSESLLSQLSQSNKTSGDSTFEILLLGLGGGGLALFLSQCFRNSNLRCSSEAKFKPLFNVDAVEIDPTVVNISKNYFGCTCANISIHCMDGILMIENLLMRVDNWNLSNRVTEDPRKDFIVIDIDSKDLNDKELSFPPQVFISEEFFHKCRMVLRNNGLLLLNYGVYVNSKKIEIQSSIAKYFSSVFEIVIPDDQNRILIGVCNHISLNQQEILSNLNLFGSFLHPNCQTEMIHQMTSRLKCIKKIH